jgi:adenine-specific DNA methylase
MTKESLHKSRQETFFAAPTDADLSSDAKVREIVGENFANWQAAGLIPDMAIEPGSETTRLMRERGWTNWHHLFSPRHLLTLAILGKACRADARLLIAFAGTLDFMSKLTRWVNSGREGGGTEFTTNVFSNQALNTFYNWGEGAFKRNRDSFLISHKLFPLNTRSVIEAGEAKAIASDADLYVTDPPYADAVNYHEITEFFIAWLRKNPPAPFDNWKWDSRRPLAIKGDGEDFRKGMVDAYRAMADHMSDNGLQIVMFTHQDAGVWGDMAQIFWGAGLRVMAAWYIATETTSELKKGGYVQGTVILVLRKRKDGEHGYKDEVVQEVKVEVADQIDTMAGLNQSLKGHGRIENLFEDADLQMAGYAAALRVLTKYTTIDGVDMTKEALRPRAKGERGLVAEIIEFAVQVANEHMVPEGMSPKVWEQLTGAERFFFKMLDIETTGAKKLDNYQNFAKAFRVAKYDDLMGSMEPNKGRLKSAKEFKKAGFEGSEFGSSKTRALLFAIYEVQNEIDGDDVLSHFRDLVPDYFNVRDDLAALADYVAKKRANTDEQEARAANILHGLIRNERFG